MKRTPELAVLSRDHHQALVVAQLLARVAPETCDAARARFVDYWEGHGRRHFRIEEELLLPAYARHVSAYDAAIARALCDHVAIRALADRVASERSGALDALTELGVALARHVRFEERELFPAIEEALPAETLSVLGEALDRAERDDG